MSQLADVFKLNPKGLNVPRAVGVAVVMVVPLIVLHALDQQVYYVSVAFGALFVGLNDPGGTYGYRLPRLQPAESHSRQARAQSPIADGLGIRHLHIQKCST